MSFAALAKPEAATWSPAKAAPRPPVRSSGLRVGEPGDVFEREADRVADRVMTGGSSRGAWSISRMGIDSPLQRKCDCGGTGDCDSCKKKGTLQRKPASTSQVAETAPASVDRTLAGSGKPLDSNVSATMGERFGYDFSRVRVHSDSAAQESAHDVRAKAYTVGHNVVFGSGQYSPSTRQGQRLIAHELAHVVQQSTVRDRTEIIRRKLDEETSESPSFNTESSLPTDAPAVSAIYPTLARFLPREALEGESSALVEVRLSQLLRPETSFIDGDIWEAYAVLSRRTALGMGAVAIELLRNEMMRQYFVGRLSLTDLVQIEVTPASLPGERTRVVLRLRGEELPSMDGTIGAVELAVFGPIMPIVEKVEREACYVEQTQDVLEHLASLEATVKEIVMNVRTQPEDFALMDVLQTQGWAHQVGWMVEDWECQAEPPLRGASSVVPRYESVLADTKDAGGFATWWHNTNTMESMGQANVRRGTNLGFRVIFGVVDTLEGMAALGMHEANNQIAEAYTDGLISWNEAARLEDMAGARALLSALVLRVAGPLGGKFGAAFATRFGLSGLGARFATGFLAGSFTNTAMMASQLIFTRLDGGNLSAKGQDIWKSGAPGAIDFAVGIGLGGVSEGLHGGLSSAPSIPSIEPAEATPNRTSSTSTSQIEDQVVNGGALDEVGDGKRGADGLENGTSKDDNSVRRPKSDSPEGDLQTRGDDEGRNQQDAKRLENDRLPGEPSVLLEKAGGEARVTEEGRCKICHSPCEYELETVQELMNAANQGTNAFRHAENLYRRISLLEEAINASKKRGTYKDRFPSSFRQALKVLSDEVDEATAESDHDEVKTPQFGGGRGIVDDPAWYDGNTRSERAGEGTAYHDYIREQVENRLPKGTVLTEKTIKDFFRNHRIDPKTIKALFKGKGGAEKRGVDLYIVDHERGVVTPVDITGYAGVEDHVEKLGRDVDRVRNGFESIGLAMNEPIEVDYRNMTKQQAANRIVSELRALADI